MQEPGSREERFDISYFDGINSTVQQRLAKRNELSHMENVRAPIIGVLEKRRGKRRVHPELSMAANYGLERFNTTAVGVQDMLRFSAPVNTMNIYALDSNEDWVLVNHADAQGINAGDVDTAVVDGDVIIVNQVSANRMLTEDLSTVTTSLSTGSLYNSPPASKVAFYKDRIYMADYIVEGVRHKTTVVRSSYQVGVLALVNGDYSNGGGSADWVIPITDSTYFYADTGVNVYDIYRGATKIATVTLASVQETTVTATHANVVFEDKTPGVPYTSFDSADEIWVAGTYEGEKVYRWANNLSATGGDVKQYNTFKLSGGDEDPITLLEPIGNTLIVGNKNTMMAWNDYALESLDYGVGCVSSKGYIKVLGSLYFIHYNGILSTTGGAPRLLSRKIQRYIDGATKSGLENAVAGYRGLSVFFAIGDVTLYNDDGSVMKTLADVCLEYAVTDENWYIHTNVPAEHMATYIDTNGVERMFFNHAGTGKYTKEFLDRTSTTDDGAEIPMRADTHDIQLMEEFETFANPISVITDIDRGAQVKVFVSLDDGPFYELSGTAKKGATTLKITSEDKTSSSPPICRRIKVSLRDFSKQLSRINQMALTFVPSTKDFSE
jgi:hypothetical protein